MKKINWKNIAIVAASCMLTAAIAIGGTLAYLTDRDSKVNVFTVGDVKIELEEDFEQGAELIPGVKIQKEPTIKNTGKNDAWVWATVAIPAALDSDVASTNAVHFNYYNAHVNDQEWTWKDSDGWLVATEEIDGVEYNVYTVLYQSALKSGAETSPVIRTVYLDSNVDIDPEGNWNVVENGVATPIDWNSNTDGAPKIYVSAYAIQTEGFDTVQEAYEAYRTQWGTNGSEWGTVSTYTEGDIELEDGEVIVVSGPTAPISVAGNGTVVLDGVSIAAEDSGSSALTIADGANVNVVVQGDTNLTGAKGGNGIEVGEGATLNLSGSGSLTVIGNGGSEDVSSSKGGSGIGGKGAIVIDGLDDLTAEGYGKHAAGIGGESTSITISDTTITNVQGGYVGEEGTDTNYYKDAPEGAPAIGSNTNGAVITLTNVKIENALGGSKAAGIGGSYWTTVTVNIDGCEINNVVGGVTSAGIGGSRIQRDGHNTTTINITKSTITAQGGTYGAGIGSGYDTYCHSMATAPVTTINIDADSKITAIGGKLGAGIGTGHNALGLELSVECDTTNVKAGDSTDGCCGGAECTTAEDVGLGVYKKGIE